MIHSISPTANIVAQPIIEPNIIGTAICILEEIGTQILSSSLSLDCTADSVLIVPECSKMKTGGGLG